jgi:hypothetical protein
MKSIRSIFKEILFNQFSLLFLLGHWILAFIYFPVWRFFSVVIHPFNEHWLTQIIMLLDLPILMLAGLIGASIKSEDSKVTYTVAVILISLQWILIGYAFSLLFYALFKKKRMEE